MNFIFSFSESKKFPIFEFYSQENLSNFFNLANYSIYRASIFGRVFLYTTEDKIELFRRNIIIPVIFRVIPENETFFWAQSKFFAIKSFLNEFNSECVHLDLDVILLKRFIAGAPEIIISHGEPYSDAGLQYLRKNNIPEALGDCWWYQKVLNDINCEPDLDEWKEILALGYAFNTSLVGGYRRDLVMDICNKVLNFVERYNEKILSLMEENSGGHLYTAVAEQGYLAHLCQSLKVRVSSYGWPGNYLHFYCQTKLGAEFNRRIRYLMEDCRYMQEDPAVFLRGL